MFAIRSYSGNLSEQSDQFFNRETRLANDAAQRAFCQFGVVGNGESPMWRIGLSQNEMTSGLMINQIANLLQCTDHFLA